MTNQFIRYAQAGFSTEVLPNIPPGAPINPAAPNPDMLLAKSGKIPGRLTADGWFGLVQWTEHIATPEEHVRWGGWGAGTGLQGRLFPAVDIDIDDPGLAAAVQALAETILGDAPCRFGREPRRLLVYAGAGHTKRRLVFRKASSETVIADAAGATVAPGEQAVELLANRQQYLVEGIHRKTGQPYYWADGRSPAEVGAANLTIIDAQQLDEFYDHLETLVVANGYVVVSRREAGSNAAPVSQESLLAPDFDAVRRAMAALPNEVDYDGWVKMCAALKASAGLENEAEAADLFIEWSLLWPQNTPEDAEALWGSMQPPYRVGWDFLSQFATEHGDGTFSAAQEEFDAVTDAPLPGKESKGPLISDKLQAVFERYVWVERLKRLCDLRTGELLDREQFNVRNSHIGDPASTKECAWAVLARDGARLQAVKGVTYRPGQGPFVEENLPGLVGRCINQWTDTTPDLPASASENEVGRWLEHVAFVLPVPQEREIVLNWLAWVIQNPGLKPNWALVIGSLYEGVGKDLMLEPVRVALGASNVREITPDDLDSSFTWYLARCRLVLVGEMKLSERKATMNKLKPLVAAPPYTLSINGKFEPQYEIPNIVAAIFSTNMENALAISGQDRRYYVTRNDGRPLDAAYYESLVAWYRDGGAALAARWLMNRDVSGFKAQGRAPDSAAKNDMRKAGRNAIEEIIEDALEDRDQELGHRAFTTDEVANLVARQLGERHRPSGSRVASLLTRAGCRKVARLSLANPPADSYGPNGKPMYTVFARADDADALVSNDEVRAVYFASRSKADLFS